MRHGKRAAAERFLARAKKHGAPANSPVEKLIDSLREKSLEDPEVPLTAETSEDDPIGLDGLEPPHLAKTAKPSDAAIVAADYLKLEKATRVHAWAHALMALKAWPENWVDEAGDDLEYLLGYVEYKADLSDEALDRLKPLSDNPEFVARRPAVLYYLARAEYGAGIFEGGVRNMEKYLSLGKN
jgi:hypothetical protein